MSSFTAGIVALYGRDQAAALTSEQRKEADRVACEYQAWLAQNPPETRTEQREAADWRRKLARAKWHAHSHGKKS